MARHHSGEAFASLKVKGSRGMEQLATKTLGSKTPALDRVIIGWWFVGNEPEFDESEGRDGELVIGEELVVWEREVGWEGREECEVWGVWEEWVVVSKVLKFLKMSDGQQGVETYLCKETPTHRI